MTRPALEIADIFRRHGAAWRASHAGHVSLAQLKVMSAIESCRTAALGGHVEACQGCRHIRIAYNSCRNRHCPKCQGAAARDWLAAREADLLPVGYFHVVFTVPSEIADIAFHNKAAVYDLLFRTASETMLTIAADPRHLGARIGITAVLHTWGSALTHHPHLHMIVPGGGISLDGERWVSSRPAFLLPVHVLAKLFRRLFVSGLLALHAAGQLRFFGDRTGLSDRQEFERYLAPIRTMKWVVYSKPPFGGPEAVLAYLSRYTHRVAIANRRLIALDEAGVTFRYKDYRRDGDPPPHQDSVRRRVHPALHRARAAQGLSPHPPLRPAGQRRPQGQHRPRPRVARRPRTDQGAGACLSRRSAPRVPLLRRAHARHREFRWRRSGPGSSPAPLEIRIMTS